MNGERINCRKCAYFQVTWEPSQPYACKAYGFKGRLMPSITVKKSSGRECQLFSPKIHK
ncbi:hypothetical protein MNB_SM-7-792 [hydrothermal vent metagenome]|uniref:Uracil-DNA glycosylase n=1 Tax=hydrothermal vent metagenome TaxID=652676 RepID=A0A1W1C4L6_9ZZZZ